MPPRHQNAMNIDTTRLQGRMLLQRSPAPSGNIVAQQFQNNQMVQPRVQQTAASPRTQVQEQYEVLQQRFSGKYNFFFFRLNLNVCMLFIFPL